MPAQVRGLRLSGAGWAEAAGHPLPLPHSRSRPLLCLNSWLLPLREAGVGLFVRLGGRQLY